MKTILKFSKLLLFTFLIVNISSCEKEDYLIFTAINQKEVKFQNEFQDVYKISQQTSNNISERLVWNAPDFDAPTTVTYVVDISTNSDFSTIDMSSAAKPLFVPPHPLTALPTSPQLLNAESVHAPTFSRTSIFIEAVLETVDD